MKRIDDPELLETSLWTICCLLVNMSDESTSIFINNGYLKSIIALVKNKEIHQNPNSKGVLLKILALLVSNARVRSEISSEFENSLIEELSAIKAQEITGAVEMKLSAQLWPES